MMRPVLLSVLGACWLATAAGAAEDEKIVDLRTTLIVEAAAERNLTLERGRVERAEEYEPQLRLQARFFPERRVWGLIETELIRRIKRERGEPTETDNRLNLTHAYLAIEDVLPDTRLRLGRWLQRDEREWLMDENLDGVHLEYDRGRWEGELFVARVDHWRRDLLDNDSHGEPVNFIAAFGRYEMDRKWVKDWQIGAYVVRQHDVSAEDTYLNHVGLRSHATPDKGWRHWLELAHVGGRDGGERVDGHAIDLGVTYAFDTAPLRPRLTLGYAYASGDPERGDRGGGAYRQTGLHSNEATFGGVAKFHIYGETLDPDLSNLHVLTAGLGLDLGRELSLDLVYHRYRQDVLSKVRETELDPEEDRRDDRHLGDAFDLVLGWRPSDRVKLEAALGWFRPSSRFRSDDDDDAPRGGDAYSARLEFNYRF
ncbi:alginate export family protein [Thauera sp. Sel9]|uniref:alginate export family protein n=1 Tax=Thauera sp. Sel9 TaxID=2974299 RepID=UPI0021E16027|nr:alginate export family protein [Thauera sp. Sel9]MCV2216424.1 alginate export family protein [Thauera sp. Sel9]